MVSTLVMLLFAIGYSQKPDNAMLLNAALVKPVLTQYGAYLFDNPAMTVP